MVNLLAPPSMGAMPTALRGHAESSRSMPTQSRGRGTHVFLIVVIMLSGCYRQQMAKQPSHHNPDQPSDFFADAQANRPLEAGTIARGQLYADSPRFTGKDGDKFVTEFPSPVTSETIERGHEPARAHSAARDRCPERILVVDP